MAVHPRAVLYVHGKGGSAAEAEHYIPLFPDRDVIGMDYRAAAPWEAVSEFRQTLCGLRQRYASVTLIANSIGAYFSLNAGIDSLIEKAYLISPVADMERLIRDMMRWANVTEAQLKAAGEIPTAFGETLSWAYLTYVRSHPIRWTVPSAVLYGEKDSLVAKDAVEAFCVKANASLTVMPEGEHWFHTPAQMDFLDRWILNS